MSADFDAVCKHRRGDRFVDPDPRDVLKVLKVYGRGVVAGKPRYYVTDDDNHSRWVSEVWLDEQEKM